jgi:fructokinase
MTKQFDVVAFGELVVDLIPAESASGNVLFKAVPGGAPGNVAAGVARLGQRAAMLSKVGPGPLGSLLIETLARAGVETRGIVRSEVYPTALAVVSLNAAGESDFLLYRDGCADSRYEPGEVALDIAGACRVLHVGSLSLGSPLSAQAQRLAVKTAKKAGALISADVNFRPAIWSNPGMMHATGREAIASADIVKVSAEELLALASAADTASAVRSLWHSGLKIFAVTHGARGAELFTTRCHVSIAGFPVKVADTVGCGDAFMAALLVGLPLERLATSNEEELYTIGRAACAAGAAVARVAGAMEHMPRRQDINTLIADLDNAGS